MLHHQTPQVNVHATPQPPMKPQVLVSQVEYMAQEIERLGEDNKQLRAAVALYREVLCRYDRRSTPASI